MPLLSIYLCPNYITYREPTINESSPTNKGCFDHRNRSIQKNKRKVTKQVYHVKKDGRLSKNPDLTQDKERSTVEKTSASSRIAPDGGHVSNDIAEQQSGSVGG
jgi:hypothetical protein